MVGVSKIVDGIMASGDVDRLSQLHSDITNNLGLDSYLVDNLKGLLLEGSVSKDDIKTFYESNLNLLDPGSKTVSEGLTDKQRLKDKISTTSRYIMYNMSDVDFYKKSIKILKILLIVVGVLCIYVLLVGGPKIPNIPFLMGSNPIVAVNNPVTITQPGV